MKGEILQQQKCERVRELEHCKFQRIFECLEIVILQAAAYMTNVNYEKDYFLIKIHFLKNRVIKGLLSYYSYYCSQDVAVLY